MTTKTWANIQIVAGFLKLNREAAPSFFENSTVNLVAWERPSDAIPVWDVCHGCISMERVGEG
jgi:hypothetical protein